MVSIILCFVFDILNNKFITAPRKHKSGHEVAILLEIVRFFAIEYDCLRYSLSVALEHYLVYVSLAIALLVYQLVTATVPREKVRSWL